MKWRGLFAGIDIDKAMKEEEKKDKLKFKDSDEYEKISDEDKEKKTVDMIDKHKKMFGLPKGVK